MYNDGVYSSSGPSLCAPARDRLGWLPINRIYTPAPNAYHFPLRLTSLSRSTASTSGYLMARIPIYTPVGEPWAYYTIEFRTANTGFDQGLSALGPDSNGVVIHRINETDQANWLVYPRFPAFGKPFSWCKCSSCFNKHFANEFHPSDLVQLQFIKQAIHSSILAEAFPSKSSQLTSRLGLPTSKLPPPGTPATSFTVQIPAGRAKSGGKPTISTTPASLPFEDRRSGTKMR